MARETETTMPRARASEVLAALEAAHVAMTTAALMLAERYGRGSQHATEMAGAALLVSRSWMPQIAEESDE